MGLRKTGLQVIENDALVVLAFVHEEATLSHHQFKRRLGEMGFQVTRSKAQSMLSRAKGRLRYDEVEGHWALTTRGQVYRYHVTQVIRRLTSCVTMS